MKGWTALRAVKSADGIDMGREEMNGDNSDGVDVCNELHFVSHTIN